MWAPHDMNHFPTYMFDEHAELVKWWILNIIARAIMQQWIINIIAFLHSSFSMFSEMQSILGWSVWHWVYRTYGSSLVQLFLCTKLFSTWGPHPAQRGILWASLERLQKHSNIQLPFSAFRAKKWCAYWFSFHAYWFLGIRKWLLCVTFQYIKQPVSMLQWAWGLT